jgi:hypothetical protein
MENQIIPAGVQIQVEWYKKIISYPTYSVYLIADNKEKLLYIGKCEYTPVIRLLDRMIPQSLNQMNNVPQIWDNFISKGQKVKCAYCYANTTSNQGL